VGADPEKERRVRFGRPLPPVVLLVALILLVLMHILLPEPRLLHPPINLVGLLLLAVGVYLNLAADGLLKRHGTTVKPFEESITLVTTGVYSRTRNPMYLGFVFLLLGVACLLGSTGPLLIVAVFPVVMNLIYIRAEEAMLSERFGEEWAAYQAKVRRWL
jgi:protein-S-isoprenylcysteine O-methyltransferase Ste14